jgi:uncharacterized membrane protein
MYDFLLIAHNWLRWAVLLVGVWAIYRNYEGFTSGRKWQVADGKFNSTFMGILHLQLTLGLIIYFVSPMMQAIMQDFGGSMKNSATRFWSIEHISGMIIAIVIAQIGAIKAKKAYSDANKFRTAFFWFLGALVLILLMIPFGIWNQERPLLRPFF